ncbi:MAG TPA: branched-chain amino acid ABC transporter permease [Terriglobales bacterium]|nr:branched-chain amino acid ABC transporter permease [Terriglobales bacterium]
MKRPQVLIGAAIFLIALVIPVFVRNDYFLQVIFRLFLFATLGLAWNLVGGYAGQLSLGHAAFFGIGAYGLALLSKGASPWLAILGGVVASMVAAVIIGSVSFRLRGPYFCLATIAFAEVVRLIAKNLPNVTGGDVGTPVPSLFPQNTMMSFYYACVVLTIAAFAINAWVERSRFGYYLMAIREDEDTALSVGVNTARVKLWSLLLSAAISAVAGALYASLFLFIVPDPVLGIELSVEISILPMLGGAGTLLGPVVGSLVLETANEVFKNIFKEAHLLIYGILVVLVVLFLPEGIVGTLMRKLRWFKAAPPPAFAATPPPGPAEESRRVPLPQPE